MPTAPQTSSLGALSRFRLHPTQSPSPSTFPGAVPRPEPDLVDQTWGRRVVCSFRFKRDMMLGITKMVR